MNPEQYPTIRQLGGSVVDVRRFIKDEVVYETDKHWSCFNMCIGYYPKKGYVATFRSSNFIYDPRGLYRIVNGATDFQSKLYFSELDNDFQPKKLREIDFSGVEDYTFTRGVEDAKLFYRDGAWHFTCVVLERNQVEQARMGIAKLDSKCTKVVEFYVVPGLDALVPEKNWMLPYEPNDNFDFIYGPNQVVKDGTLYGWMTDTPETAMLRGNTNLHSLGDGTYLGVMHRTFTKTDNRYVAESFGTISTTTRDYVHYFVRFGDDGMIISVSEGFKFHSPGIEFACGLVAQKKDFLISFGKNDVSCHVARIPMDTVLQSLKKVNY